MKTKWESRPCEFADLAERAVSRRWAAFSALLALTFFRDFLQILFCKLKGLLPSPRSNFADLRLAGDLRIFVNFGPILNLIRRRVNIKFSAPSKIKLRSLP